MAKYRPAQNAKNNEKKNKVAKIVKAQKPKIYTEEEVLALLARAKEEENGA